MTETSILFLNEFFKDSNIIIALVTLISFIGVLIWFFKSILGEYYVEIIKDKASLVSLYAKENPKFKKQLLDTICEYNKKENDIEEIQKEIQTRHENNANVLWKFGIWTFLTIIASILVLYILTLLILRITKSRIISWSNPEDTLLLFLGISSFAVELVFFFVIVRKWKFMADSEFIKILIDPDA